MSSSATPHSDAVLQQAVARHRAGELAQAESGYRAVIGAEPRHAEANHNLGVLMVQAGRVEEGLVHLGRALQSNEREALYFFSYAKGLLAAGEPAEADAILRRADQLGLGDKRFEPLRSQIQSLKTGVAADDKDPYAAAVRHHRAGHMDEAVRSYRQAIKAAPANPDAHEGLASALCTMGAFDMAVQAYGDALAVSPGNAALLDNMGNALLAQGKVEEAILAYRKAVAAAPDFAEAHYHLGSVLSEHGRVDQGFRHYMRRAALVHGGPTALPADQPDPPYKVKHDREQRDYLEGSRPSPHALDTFQLADGSRLDGPAVNSANATTGLFDAWRQAEPQMVVIDNFLTAPALEKLRAYCAGSTVWKKQYPAGYLGAAPEDGFAAPILAQIVEEIQTTFRPILDNEAFRYLGAFKYDSDLCSGTNTHADNSAINVNFYIAPDEANLDPESGGMEIWHAAAPDLETLRRYNSNEPEVLAFLARSATPSTVVPHRTNRAVIFRSALFHKTDRFKFRSDYLHRRINISLLFGHFR